MHTSSLVAHSQVQRSAAPALASFQVRPLQRAGVSPARQICIEAAHTERQHRSANRLLQQRYHWRGYRAVSLPAPGSVASLPLTATRDGAVIGTLTVGFDSPRGLNCDRSFADEVQALRGAGQRLCEFTKLAVQADDGSVQVLAALFHVAFLAACHLHRVDTVLLEVNPRHVRYYQRMLGAEVVGQQRCNDSVDAPAVLLAIACDHIRQQIDQALWPQRAQPGQDRTRSLYTQAFSRAEECAIVTRLAAHLGGHAAHSGTPQHGWPALQASQHGFEFRLPVAQASAAHAV